MTHAVLDAGGDNQCRDISRVSESSAHLRAVRHLMPATPDYRANEI